MNEIRGTFSQRRARAVSVADKEQTAGPRAAAPASIGKVYESAHAGYAIRTERGSINFREVRLSKKLRLGVLTSDDPLVFKKLGFGADVATDKPLAGDTLKNFCDSLGIEATPEVRKKTGRQLCTEYVERVVERQQEFSDGKAMERGIWLRPARIDREFDREITELDKILKQMSVETLRVRLSKLEIPYSPNDDRDELLAKYLAGRVTGKD